MSNYKEKYLSKQKFYNFEVTQNKFGVLTKQLKTNLGRNFFKGIVIGFLVEALICNTNIYENSVKKATNRRLENKYVEEKYLSERFELAQKKNETDV